MNLKYCCMTAQIKYRENRHAQVVIKELGITYKRATPQSLFDCWQFWGCDNVPDNLPKYIKEFKAPAGTRE